jgi:hypothetical protein
MPGKFGNFIMKTMVQSPLHALVGDNLAVIMVEGSKTGKRYSTPINVVKDGEGFTVTSLRSRTWWRNLRDGKTAQLHVAGRKLPVQAEVVEDDAGVMKVLTEYFIAHPVYAKYYKVRLDDGGEPNLEDIRREAEQRVVVRLRLIE